MKKKEKKKRKNYYIEKLYFSAFASKRKVREHATEQKSTLIYFSHYNLLSISTSLTVLHVICEYHTISLLCFIFNQAVISSNDGKIVKNIIKLYQSLHKC